MTRRYSRRSFMAGAALAGAGLSVPLFSRVAQAQSARRLATIVDTQVNLWTGGKPPASRRQAPFLAANLLAEMDKAGVSRAVVIPVSWNPDGIETPLAAARSHPDRFRVFGIFDFKAAPDPTAFVTWSKREGMLGARLFLNNAEGQAWLENGSADWLWPVAEAENIPLMIYCVRPAALRPIAQKYPKLKICIDALGSLPDKRGLAAFAEHDTVLALAQSPNVTIKLTGLPFLSTEQYPFSNLEPVIRRTYDAFGARRMFWGSDITLLEPLGVSYGQSISSFAGLAWLPDADLDLIMGQAFLDWSGWRLP